MVIFCQKEIINSGLVLDEDLVFLKADEPKKNGGNKISQGGIIIAMAATTACTTAFALRKASLGKIISVEVISGLPLAFSLLKTILQERKTKNQKQWIVRLLNEFKSLSRIHVEVNDFLKCFTYSM